MQAQEQPTGLGENGDSWGALGIGSLAGGFAAEITGLLLTLWVGAIRTVFSVLWIFFSPVRSLRE